MSILTPDYERLQNASITDGSLVQQYKQNFKNQDIDSAHNLITTDNDYLVMDSNRLNDLCDTITYMQNIWAEDKSEFANHYFAMGEDVSRENVIDPRRVFWGDGFNEYGITIKHDPSSLNGAVIIDGVATRNINIKLFDDKMDCNNFISVTGGVFDNNLSPSSNILVQLGIEEEPPRRNTGYGLVVLDVSEGVRTIGMYMQISEGTTFVNDKYYLALTRGNISLSDFPYYQYTTYASSSQYNIGSITYYDDHPYMCIENNTTGTWDDSKWIKLGGDDVGLRLGGESSPLAQHINGTFWADTSDGFGVKVLPRWYAQVNDVKLQLATTYPNIRYLTNESSAYTNEIYMTEWNGGGA